MNVSRSHTGARWLALALGVVMMAGLSGCTSGPKSPGRSSSAGGVRLEAKLFGERNGVPGLYVEYTVTNDGAVPATVLDRLPAGAVNGTTYLVAADRGTVDVYADGVVELSKRSYDTPKGVALFTPWKLQGTRVAPGSSVNGVAFTPFPLARVGIGFDIEPVGVDKFPASTDRWRFCIEVGQAGDYKVEAADEGLPSVWVVNPMHGDILCTPEQPLPDGWHG